MKRPGVLSGNYATAHIERCYRGYKQDDCLKSIRIKELEGRVSYLEADKKRFTVGYHKMSAEIDQTLGRALGFPRYCDDQKSFPGATDADGVCTGDHVPETLADAAARRIKELEGKLDDLQVRHDCSEAILRARTKSMNELEMSLHNQGEHYAAAQDYVEGKLAAAEQRIAELEASESNAHQFAAELGGIIGPLRTQLAQSRERERKLREGVTGALALLSEEYLVTARIMLKSALQPPAQASAEPPKPCQHHSVNSGTIAGDFVAECRDCGKEL